MKTSKSSRTAKSSIKGEIVCFCTVSKKIRKNTDSLVTENIKKYTGIELSDFDINRSHRLGKPKPNKPRPIIVNFTRYNIRSKIFSSKKTFKGSNISLTESLTQKRVDITNEARNKHGFKNDWTADGKILYVGDDDKIRNYLEWTHVVSGGWKEIVVKWPSSNFTVFLRLSVFVLCFFVFFFWHSSFNIF